MHHHDYDYAANDNSGGLWCLFGIVTLLFAAVWLILALMALTVYAICKAVIAWQEERYIAAALWGGLFLFLAIAWPWANPLTAVNRHKGPDAIGIWAFSIKVLHE